MTRATRSIFAGIVFLLALVIVTPRWLGTTAHHKLNRLVQQYNHSRSGTTVALNHYQQGWFSSQASLSVFDQHDHSMTLKLKLFHGPLIHSNGLHLALFSIKLTPKNNVPALKSLSALIDFSKNAVIRAQFQHLFGAPFTQDQLTKVTLKIHNINNPTQINTHLTTTHVKVPLGLGILSIGKLHLDLHALSPVKEGKSSNIFDNHWTISASQTSKDISYNDSSIQINIHSSSLGRIHFYTPNLTSVLHNPTSLMRIYNPALLFAATPTQIINHTLTPNSHVTLHGVSIKTEALSLKENEFKFYINNIKDHHHLTLDTGLVIKGVQLNQPNASQQQGSFLQLNELSFNHIMLHPNQFLALQKIAYPLKPSALSTATAMPFKNALYQLPASLIGANTSIKVSHLKGQYRDKNNEKAQLDNISFLLNFKTLPQQHDLYDVLHNALMRWNIKASLQNPQFNIENVKLNGLFTLSKPVNFNSVSFDSFRYNNTASSLSKKISVNLASLQSNMHNRPHDYDLSTTIRVPQYCINQQCYKDNLIQWSFKNLKRLSRSSLKKEYLDSLNNHVRQLFNPKDPTLNKNHSEILKRFTSFFTPQGSFNIDTIRLHTPLGNINASAQVSLPPYRNTPPMEWLKQLPVTATVTVNQKIINQLNDKGGAAVMPLLLKQGYVIKNNEQYSVDFASKQGQLFLNNKLLTPSKQEFLLKSIDSAQGEVQKKNTLGYQHALEQLQLTANHANESQLYFRCLSAAQKAGDNNNACNRAHSQY